MAGELGIQLSKEAMVNTPNHLDINLIFKNIDREHLLFHDKTVFKNDDNQKDYKVKSFFCGNECSYICINDYLLGIGNKYSSHNEHFPMVMEMKRGIQVKAISCGESHTVMVDYNGSVYTWGKSEYGKLGHPNVYGNFKSKTCKAKTDGDTKEKNYDDDGNILDKPTLIYSLNMLKVFSAVAGSTFTLVLTEDGEIYSIGKFGKRRNQTNEMDYIKPLKCYAYSKCIEGQEPSYVKLCCGYHHAGAIDEQGNVYFWGQNFEDALSIFKDGKDKPGPALVEEFMKMGLKAVDIACGRNFSICIFDDCTNKMNNADYLNKKYANFERIKRKLNIDDFIQEKKDRENEFSEILTVTNKKIGLSYMKDTFDGSIEQSPMHSIKNVRPGMNLTDRINNIKFGQDFVENKELDKSEILEQENQQFMLGNDSAMTNLRRTAISSRLKKIPIISKGVAVLPNVPGQNTTRLNYETKGEISNGKAQYASSKKFQSSIESGKAPYLQHGGKPLNLNNIADYSKGNIKANPQSKSGI